MLTALWKLSLVACCRQLLVLDSPCEAQFTTSPQNATIGHLYATETNETVEWVTTTTSNSSLWTTGQPKNYSARYQACIKWRLFSPGDFTLQENNVLVYKAGKVNTSFGPNEYHLVRNNTAYACIPDSLRPEWAFVDYIYWSTRGLSIFFLALSIALHVWLLRGISERDTRAIVCHKISLLIFYGSMWVYLRRRNDVVFKIHTTISAYGVNAAYCWINVISYDMWLSFHPKRMFRHTPAMRHSVRHFVGQSVYAWGQPALILACSFALSLLPLPPITSWKRAGPIYGNIVQIPFMVTCTSIIVLVNGVFCGLTICNILRTRQDSALLYRKSEASHAIFRVYVKLVLVSGFLYLLDLAEWVHLHADFFAVSWLIPDWLSSAQGLWLFLVYCCNKSVLGAI